jgi:two-component system chemotaxis sensor kinase CheA
LDLTGEDAVSDLDDVVKEFLVESFENMDRLDRDLVALERDPSSREILARIFRTIHTIKGTCGFLAFGRLEAVAHAGENLLSRLRDGTLRLTPEITSALLAMVDAVRNMLAHIEATGSDGDNGYQELIDLLTRLQGAASAPEPSAAPHVAPPPPEGATPSSPPAAARPGDTEHPSYPPGGHALGAGDEKEQRSMLSDSTIRVDVGLLDKLMNLVGELVLARNQILQFSASQKEAAFLATTQRLNLITTELQEGVMKTRMQPIGNIWGKFPRVVRDLAVSCGKQVQIEMHGRETELDKTIIEAIKDPLTHLIRNAVDHGIEEPARRVTAGKPPVGRLSLRAFHEGGQVNIEISDDGAGIDPERIRQKALQRGLCTHDQMTRMSDRDTLGLIFLPGFSTAESVTSISGRGVGMDVVKTNIEKIGGSVDVQTRLGQGSTFKIKIPLTLAIIPALIVTAGGDRYAIPQVSLLELVRLEGDRIRRSVEHIHGAPIYRLRGELLPLLDLGRELGLPSPSAGNQPPEVLNIVVLQAGDRAFGLIVDGINDTEEIVVKPLGKQLKGLSCFAGATIMGDGRVALILDVLGLAQRGGVISESREEKAARRTRSDPRDGEESLETLLLFQTRGAAQAQGPSGGHARMAIPLSLVARLEEFPKTALERTSDMDVVQYRDQILPLVYLDEVLPAARSWSGQGLGAAGPSGAGAGAGADDEKLQVVVYSDGRLSVGLVVERILDIVEERIGVRLPSGRRGIHSSAVIQGRVTEMVDLEGVLRSALPDLFAQRREAGLAQPTPASSPSGPAASPASPASPAR